MRYIVISLLMANLLFLGWGFWQGPATDSRVPRVPVTATGSANSLLLLTELAAVPVMELPSPTSTDIEPTQCVQVGQFSNLEDAYQVMEQARDKGLLSRLLVDGEILSSQYRVYLPPLASRDDAAGMLETLRQSAIGDDVKAEGFLITRGALENGIAFGIFTSEAQARTVQEELLSAGFVAEIGEVPAAEGAIFVEIQVGKTEGFAEQFGGQIMLDRPYLTQTQNVCETIAQGL